MTTPAVNPQFKKLILTDDAVTIISKLPNGLADVPWAEAVIAANVGALTDTAIPTTGVLQGVCNGVKIKAWKPEISCNVMCDKTGVSLGALGVYANITLSVTGVVTLGTGKKLMATAVATDPTFHKGIPREPIPGAPILDGDGAPVLDGDGEPTFEEDTTFPFDDGIAVSGSKICSFGIRAGLGHDDNDPITTLSWVSGDRFGTGKGLKN